MRREFTLRSGGRVLWWRYKGRSRLNPRGSRVDRSLEVACVPILERASEADLDRDGAQVRCDPLEGWVYRLGDRIQTTDDAGEVVLVLRDEVLDWGDAFGPETEEIDEGEWAVVFREVELRSLFAYTRKGNRGRVRRASKCREEQT